MAKHRLDLLPLLDVFMVVLFVFATIQEQRLDATVQVRDELAERMADLEEVLRQTRALEQQRDRQVESEVVAKAEQRDAALSEVKAEAEHLRRELQKARESFTEQKDEVRASLAEAGVPEEALRRVDLLSRVLDKYSVFEIEVVGSLDEEGAIVNHCCYRVDPLGDGWQSCGEVPQTEEERENWLEGGAGGLTQALRRTKGGNAMTLVRQDQRTTHRIATKMVDLLRERYSDQHFYAEDELELDDHCRDAGRDPAPSAPE